MANLKYKCYMLYKACKNSISEWLILCQGQKPEYEILQTAHRLEKGLINPDPKPQWGWEKMKRLIQLVNNTNSKFESDTGIAVIGAYLEAKKASTDKTDIKNYNDYKSNIINGEFEKLGGANLIKAPKFAGHELSCIEEFFRSRHSVRTFSSRDIPHEFILRAIELSNRCPSACNRQPFHVYVVDQKVKKQKISDNDGYLGNKFLYVTGDISAFTIGEFNDWIVSPSIFVGYLTLAMHAYGIGTCVIRKDLVCDTEYNKRVKKVCGIPSHEKLIIELAIGFYEDEFVVPVSNRKAAKDITSFVEL